MLTGIKNYHSFLKSVFAIPVFMLMLVACESGPRDIRIGEQECDHCRMMISDERFASQLITSQGRQYAFDAIECMVAFTDYGDGRDLDVQGKWVPDFNQKDTWLHAGEAVYLQSDGLRSPMALNLSAYGTKEEVQEQQLQLEGRILQWHELREVVREAWSHGTGH